ncbi:UNVERIFIED_CONTAM: hypothetical protein K2H54_015399 [Gekko kuhli]
MVPFLIHTGTSERICIHLSHLNESVTLSATLEHGAQNRSLIDDVVSEKDFFQCIPFTVPKCNASSQMILRVVVKGPTHTFTSQKMVLVKNLDSLAFVQTDKPIYKPGQKVLFRIISLNEDFLPLNEKFPLVYIQDPERNRLFQWRDVQLQNGLTRLSFPLTSEPTLGFYKVVAQKASGNNVEHTFSVEEYVLPKFEVSVKVPKIITIRAQELRVTACARYTYGKPVPGLVKVEVCRNFQDHRSYCAGWRTTKGICEEFSGEADVHGCLSRVIKASKIQLERTGYEMNIKVTAKVTEEGTGVELLATGSTEITDVLSKLVFQKVDTHYKPGIPFFGQVKLVDVNNAPMANEIIQLYETVSGHAVLRYTTDDQGIAQFSLPTDNLTDEVINIHAMYKTDEQCYGENWVAFRHQDASHDARPFHSPSGSYLHIESVVETLSCEHIQPVRIHYILKPGAVLEKIHFYYLVMAKGGIVQSGIHVEPAEHAIAKGVFHLDLSVDVHTAPLARVLVYVILPSGELVAHSAGFAVENCFSNKVKLAFAATEGLPGSNTHLHLAASKDSLCAIRAVDKSVLLLKPEAELSPQTVYNLLPVKDLRGYSYQNDHLNDPDLEKCVTPTNIIVDGIQYTPVHSQGKGEPYEILKNVGLKVFTNVRIRQPPFCLLEAENSIRGFNAAVPTQTRKPDKKAKSPQKSSTSAVSGKDKCKSEKEPMRWSDSSADLPKVKKQKHSTPTSTPALAPAPTHPSDSSAPHSDNHQSRPLDQRSLDDHMSQIVMIPFIAGHLPTFSIPTMFQSDLFRTVTIGLQSHTVDPEVDPGAPTTLPALITFHQGSITADTHWIRHLLPPMLGITMPPEVSWIRGQDPPIIIGAIPWAVGTVISPLHLIPQTILISHQTDSFSCVKSSSHLGSVSFRAHRAFALQAY